MKDFGLENRKYVIAGIAVAIVTVYIIRLFMLQVTSDDYKKSADSNAFLKKVEYPSRGVIHDRHGKLMVYNQPAYDIMVIMNEAKDHIDTLELCQALGITKEYFMGTCPKGHADGRSFLRPDGSTIGKVFMDKPRICSDFYKNQKNMSTERYSQYVVVNEATVSIVWHDSRDNAVKVQNDNGGKLYDFNKDNPVIIERALQAARRCMGVE